MSTLTHAFRGLLLVVGQAETRAEKPTVQMIFRSCYQPVEKPEDYLTGKAHPTFTFDGCLVTESDDKNRRLEAKVVG